MSALNKLRDYLVLSRLHNCLLAAASVLIGSYLANPAMTLASLIGATATLLVAAGGYALNDVYDIGTDRMNKPWRAVASGRISKRSAIGFTAICWAAGVVLSVFAGPVALDFASAYVVLLWLYSFRLKSAGVAGPLLVSAVSASGFLLGAGLGGNSAAGLPPFALAFAFHFAREVAKGAADLPGDSDAGIGTLAVRMGWRGLAILCSLSIGAVMALSIIPFAAGIYGIFYFVPVLAMQPLLALCIYLIVATGEDAPSVSRAYWRVARILKAIMPVGLIAFLLGSI